MEKLAYDWKLTDVAVDNLRAEHNRICRPHHSDETRKGDRVID
jgi:hypothetical protein